MSTSVPTKEAIVPRYGTEAERVTKAALILTDELHQTTDQVRLFLRNVIVSGGKNLGSLANAAARRGFNAANPGIGCWPGDFCKQTDTTPATVWQCITNHGETEDDWIQIGGGTTGDFIPTSAKGAASGVATLDSGGKLPVAQLPDLAIVDFLGSVSTQVAMLALVGQKGDWCIRSDLSTVWIVSGSDPTILSSWTQVSYPTAPVTTVAGRTGAVVLTSADVGLNNLTNDAQVKATEKGAANGVATLDSGTHVPVEQLPIATSGTLGVVKPGTGVSIDAYGVISFLSSIAFLLSWLSFDNFEQYSVGANNVLDQGYSWAGSGSIDTVEVLSYDDMEAETAGANNVLTHGIGWAGSGTIDPGEVLSYDDMEAETVGANNVLSNGIGWAGSGNIAYI